MCVCLMCVCVHVCVCVCLQHVCEYLGACMHMSVLWSVSQQVLEKKFLSVLLSLVLLVIVSTY